MNEQLVRDFEVALADARRQNAAADQALKSLRDAARTIAVWCDEEAKKRGVDLDRL